MWYTCKGGLGAMIYIECWDWHGAWDKAQRKSPNTSTSAVISLSAANRHVLYKSLFKNIWYHAIRSHKDCSLEQHYDFHRDRDTNCPVPTTCLQSSQSQHWVAFSPTYILVNFQPNICSCRKDVCNEHCTIYHITSSFGRIFSLFHMA